MKDGVVSGKLPLSREPVFGDWMLQVSTSVSNNRTYLKINAVNVRKNNIICIKYVIPHLYRHLHMGNMFKSALQKTGI